MVSSPEISSFGSNFPRASAGRPGTDLINAGAGMTVNNDKNTATAPWLSPELATERDDPQWIPVVNLKFSYVLSDVRRNDPARGASPPL
jgi:hypothetical protein